MAAREHKHAAILRRPALARQAEGRRTTEASLRFAMPSSLASARRARRAIACKPTLRSVGVSCGVEVAAYELEGFLCPYPVSKQ